MRCTNLIVAGVALIVIGCASVPTEERSTGAETEIRAVIDAYEKGREARDLDAVAKLLTDDVDQLTSSGEWRIGVDASLEGMKRSTQQNPGTRTLTVERVRQLSPTTALADARYTIANPNGDTRNLWSTFVLTRTDTGWQITAIRNMRPATN